MAVPICEDINIEQVALITTKLNLIELKSPSRGDCGKTKS